MGTVVPSGYGADQREGTEHLMPEAAPGEWEPLAIGHGEGIGSVVVVFTFTPKCARCRMTETHPGLKVGGGASYSRSLMIICLSL